MSEGQQGGLLLTGATGFVGGQILARHLERSDRHVHALVRAADDREARARLNGVIAAIYGSPDAYADRLTAIPGDLTRPDLGLDARRVDELAEQVSDVVHAAASVSFSDPLDGARAINVEGTRRVLELAERCRDLRLFAYVSTTYVAGMHDAGFGEDDLDVGQGFRNSYERSKLEAEQIVRDRAERLPVRIFRPSIVVGESTSGWTPTFNVLYYPLKLFARGVNPPIVPARRDTPIDAVPVDYVADAIVALSERDGPSGETFQLVAGPDAGTVGELLDTAAHRFGRRPPTLIPLGVYMRTLHPVLSRAYRGKRKRQLARGAEFLPYFSMRQTFEDGRARTALEPHGLSVPPLHDYFDRLLDYAVAAEWGRAPMSRAQARARS
jgi:thioester reductase-like protein